MKNLTKSQKVEIFREEAVKLRLTAYKIAQATGLSERAIQYIIDGKSKNPHSNNVEKLYNYITEIKEDRARNFAANEEPQVYSKFSFELNPTEDLTVDGIIARRMAHKLQPIIEKMQESMTTTQRTVLVNAKELERMKIQMSEMQRKLNEMHEVVVPQKKEN